VPRGFTTKRFLFGAITTIVLFGGMGIDSARPARAAGSISPATLSTVPAHVGSPYATTLTFGGLTTWRVTKGKLPPGLSLTAGVISGVPTQPGAFTFKVKAVDGSNAATKGYTIFVRPATTSGFDTRVQTELQQRAVGAAPGCNKTGDLSNAIATIQLGQEVEDANARLARLKITQIGGSPPACNSHVDQSRNNLMLSLLYRPYGLYSSGSSFFPGMLTPAAEKNLVLQMWNFARPYSKVAQAANTWELFDSENHDAQAESFYFLAAQTFKNRPEYKKRKYADGSTVAKQYKAWHDHWSHYFDERAKRGLFVEAAAPSYHGYTLDAILNIYNFADDPVLRQKAGMLLDIDFADFALQQLKHIWGGAKSRSYVPSSYNGAADDMTLLANLLYGPTPKKGDNHALMLASSGYYPPPVVSSMINDRASMGSFVYKARRPGVGPSGFDDSGDWKVNPVGSVLTYTYSTPKYVMGTAQLQPKVKHVAPSRQNRWEGIIFNTTPGDRVYPQAGPADFSPANDAFLSVQNKNVLVTAKQAHLDEPTFVYFPNTLDKLTEKGGWIFVKEGGAYLAVKPATAGYQWLTSARNKASNRAQRFIRLGEAEAPIIFEAGTTSTYPTLAAFRAKILKNKFKYNGTLAYRSSNGTRFTFFKGNSKAPLVNGKGPGYNTKSMFSSPFMTSKFGSGKITIKKGPYRATYDFSRYARPLKSIR
jgi:Putative Ig domain